MPNKLLSLLMTLLVTGLWAQRNTKQDLLKQNNEIKNQINMLNSSLSKTKAEERLSLAYLNDINQKINLREKLYNNTHKEKKLVEDEIYKTQLNINKYNRELDALRKEYARILVNAYKNKGVQNKVTFILSSNNLGQAIRRVQYLKRYAEYQKKKAKEITLKTQQIAKTVNYRKKAVQEKEKLILTQQQDLKNIEAERAEKQTLLEEFKKNEVQLTAEINKRQAESRVIEANIKALIAAELKAAKAEAEARRKAEAERKRLAMIAAEKEKRAIEELNRARLAALAEAKRKAEAEERRLAEIARQKAEEERKNEIARKKAEEENRLELLREAEVRKIALEKERAEATRIAKAAQAQAEAARLAQAEVEKKKEEAKKAVEEKQLVAYGISSPAGANIADNRGRLPFPAERGNIVERFGRHQHPVFPRVTIQNNGIKIAAPEGTRAKVVFAGVVSNVMISGEEKIVMVKHGDDIFTIYGGLSSVNVSRGQTLSAGSVVGVLGKNFEGVPTLDFQIFKGETPMDPQTWLN